MHAFYSINVFAAYFKVCRQIYNCWSSTYNCSCLFDFSGFFCIIRKTHKRTQIFFSTIQFQELKLCYGKTITFSHNIPRSVVVKANGMMVLWHMCQNERKHSVSSGTSVFFLFCIEKGYILQSVAGLLKRSQSYSSRKSHIWVLVNVILKKNQ